jgi:hypothetical protein
VQKSGFSNRHHYRPRPAYIAFQRGKRGRHISVLAHGHQTELETLFDFGFYNYAAPHGAENESGPFPPVFPALPPAFGSRLHFISARRDTRCGE